MNSRPFQFSILALFVLITIIAGIVALVSQFPAVAVGIATVFVFLIMYVLFVGGMASMDSTLNSFISKADNAKARKRESNNRNGEE